MLQGRKVTVVGLGISGRAAALFLHSHHAIVKVTDSSDRVEVQKREEELKEKGIECELGRHTEDFIDGTELFVTSPGVDNNSLPIEWAENNNIPIISEIELGYRFCKGTIIAVTGTNGKSTVVSQIGEIFKKAGRKVFVCGNIGTPFISIVSNTAENDMVILEISSFQLERIGTFRPNTAVMLNIAEDHLDRYRDFDEYKDAKFRLFANQKENDCAIINYDQAKLKELKDSVNSKKLYFSKRRLPKEYDGAYVENEELIVRRNGKYIWLASRESLSLIGEHNLENALVSGLVGFVFGVEPEIIKDVLYNFKGLNHRFEFVGTFNGVRFIDDSKATNVDSVRRAIQSSPKGIILIAGGKDKGGDYRVLTKLLKEKVKLMILLGEAKEKIAKVFSKVIHTSFVENLEEGVKTAFKSAKRGDTILLSPMCSSFDMFTDYKERGAVFRQAVEELSRISAKPVPVYRPRKAKQNA